jgi:hypothetical protein
LRLRGFIVPNTFVSGTDGRVIVDDVTVAGIYTWTLEGVTGIIKIPHYEGFVDTNQRMWTPKLFGLSDGSGTLEGYFDTNAGNTTDSVLTNGIEVVLQLIIVKGTNFGFGVFADLSNFRTTDAVENQPAKWSANFEVNGAIPLSAIVAL